MMCGDCAEAICECGEGCSNCATVCLDCAQKCSNCSEDEICVDCGMCVSCVGSDNFCSECYLCSNCAGVVCSCGSGCSNCAVVCMDCGEACENCSDELCVDCGKCINCSGADGFCINCGLCGECTVVCQCGEGCESCADICPECGEQCSSCCDEFCASCDICRNCAGDLWCEDCYQCGECTEICEDCGIVCRDCAESVCEECGKCSGCISEFCPDCGICMDCADAMCIDCYYCGDCADAICDSCNEYCSVCAQVCEECGICENCVDICGDCELCKECCEDAAKAFGCNHGICVNSNEWRSHYCDVGDHCIEDSSKIEYDETEHWIVCGDGCDAKLNADVHIFGTSKVTKEATEKEEGERSYYCNDCDYVKQEPIPKLTGGHTHKYTDSVTKPTCKEGGYTTHTCECGHSWKDGEVSATAHEYEYKDTNDEHWKECIHCHEVTAKGAHKMGEWTTVKKAGYTFEGEKQRKCNVCGYTVSQTIDKLTKPEDKYVVIIPGYSQIVETPSTPGDSTPTTAPEATPTTAPDGKPVTPSGGTSAPAVKEMLTKGDEQTVPALPTLPPTEDGNKFDGWVDKATGEPVKKGDKLTGNIELTPVWKDCGEGAHADGDEDDCCDECGYVMKKQPTPTETPTPTPAPDSTPTPTPVANDDPSGGDENDETDEEKPSEVMPMWAIVSIPAAAAVAAAGGGILIAKKKKEEKDKK